VYGIVQLVWRKQKHTLWRRPIINQSSTAILLCIFVTSWFVTSDSSFLLGLLCYGWLSFCNHESSLHKVFTCITSQFVTNGNSFVFKSSLFCYYWLSFCSHESSLHRVFFKPDFCWLFGFVFSLGCVYLCSHLPCTFDGWVPFLDFHFQGVFSSFGHFCAKEVTCWERESDKIESKKAFVLEFLSFHLVKKNWKMISLFVLLLVLCLL